MTTVDTAKLIKEIQSNGILAGIAINPFEDLLPFERYLCDYFLVMGVSPGFSGQKFNSTTFDKINELKSNSYTDQKGIIVDGGVNLDNINELMRLGVQGCVLGNAIFNGNNIENNIQQIQKNLGSVK
jgi:ribulose-phosphate 3-epimerase